MVLMKRNHRYLRYCRFHLIPREIWFGMGVTHNGVVVYTGTGAVCKNPTCGIPVFNPTNG
jgi:hypothetical protein